MDRNTRKLNTESSRKQKIPDCSVVDRTNKSKRQNKKKKRKKETIYKAVLIQESKVKSNDKSTT